MKRFLYIIMSMAVLTAHAAGIPNCKSVVRVICFTATGDTLSQGAGFFISADGQAVVPYSIMKGAARAELIDWKQKSHPVTLILGANSNYDLVRLQSEARKMEFLPIAQGDTPQGTVLTLLHYDTNKKAVGNTATLTRADKYGDYHYYALSTPNDRSVAGLPLVNGEGEAVAVAQYNYDKQATTACAISARFAPGLTIPAMGALNADLRNIAIARDLPAAEDDAFTYLYMLHRMTTDSVQYVQASQRFAERFPRNVKGYTETAAFYAEHGNYAQADEALTAALDCKNQADEAHYNLAEIIYQKALHHPQPPYKDWTLERALAESQTAFNLRPDTVYLQQQAHILFGMKRYAEAESLFLTAAKASKSPAELYHAAAMSRERLGAEPSQVIALIDSAVACYQRPYPAEAAAYLFSRAQHLETAGRHREAVQDYRDYEKAVGTKNLTAKFYNILQQAEQNAHQYQQAIDDLHTAIALAPTTAEKGEYQTEIAFIYLRAGMYEEAIVEAQAAQRLAPESSDVFKALGVAHGELGHKAEALKHLSRAQALGDTDAQKFIDRYATAK